ncbi:hypothetical protein EON63_00770 [archaeon]|nr:MAG: hypothetical protein EON63_00770 [archaeon]
MVVGQERKVIVPVLIGENIAIAYMVYGAWCIVYGVRYIVYGEMLLPMIGMSGLLKSCALAHCNT